MQSLKSLNMENTKLGSRGVIIIGETLFTLRGLEHFNVSSNEIGSAGAAGLSKIIP